MKNIETIIANLDKQHKHPIPQSYTVIGYSKTGKPIFRKNQYSLNDVSLVVSILASSDNK